MNPIGFAPEGRKFDSPNHVKKSASLTGYGLFGTADKIRTCDLQSRSLTLYPAELQPRMWNDRLAAVIRFFNNSGQTVVKNPRLLSPETRNRCVANALRLISTECA